MLSALVSLRYFLCCSPDISYAFYGLVFLIFVLTFLEHFLSLQALRVTPVLLELVKNRNFEVSHYVIFYVLMFFPSFYTHTLSHYAVLKGCDSVFLTQSRRIILHGFSVNSIHPTV